MSQEYPTLPDEIVDYLEDDQEEAKQNDGENDLQDSQQEIREEAQNETSDPKTKSIVVSEKEKEAQSNKIVILGIPWETDEATLEHHFSNFGTVIETQIMRERHTGKSRGFGFVTFKSPEDASKAISTDHTMNGRRCEAKYALPEGRVGSARTTRIFVARVPSSVTETQFREYFEQFGTVEDAYMPKDISKHSHRGIGFVTFTSPESVETLMSKSHVLNGSEIAIDRATPKDRHFPTAGRGYGTQMSNVGMGRSSRPFGSRGQGMKRSRAMYDSGMARPGMSSDYLSSGADFNLHARSQVQAAPLQHRFSGGINMQQNPRASSSHQLMINSTDIPRGRHGVYGHPPSSANDLMGPSQRQRIGDTYPAAGHPGWIPSVSAPNAGSISGGRTPAHAGPRIFVGKLPREATEHDVKEYFSRFGYVLDVYLPRDKFNKREHRGFGFVTFETDASIQRVVSHGAHKIHGATIAIDSAAPRQEEAFVPGVDTSVNQYL